MKTIRRFWLKRAESKLQERRGALTVEAALVMPVLLCAFFTVIFLVKTVCTYGLVQHALDETASEIASAGYIYHISGIRDFHDTVRNGINDRSELFKGQIDNVFETFDSLKSLGSSINEDPGQSPEALADTANGLGDAAGRFQSMLGQAGKAAGEPLEELKSIACYIAAGSVDDAKTQLFTPVVKLYMRKYLINDSIRDADERLKMLNIENGFSGLDFSESSFLSDRDENIDIVVRYRINLILPVSFMPDLEIVQRSRARAWLGGDDSSGVLDGSGTDNAEDIWSLDNFKRGYKIRRQFRANLPDSFPVISAFSGGKAVVIKSMDLTAESYQRGDKAEDTLKGYINDLAKYKGQESPWGSAGIVIKKDSITSREILLVIPENKLSDSNEALLNDMRRYAEAKGIVLNVKRYGTKKIATETSGTNEGETGEAGQIRSTNDGKTSSGNTAGK